MRRGVVTAAQAVALTLLFGTVAQAQPADGAPADPGPSTGTSMNAAPAAPEVSSELELFNLDTAVQQMVSVAGKREERLDETPGSVTVITRDMIRDMNAMTLREVLNAFVPGMDVVPTYFRYGDRVNEGIYSRGLLSDFSQQVLILYNGQSKWNETTFSSPFVAVQFNLENIERIEISRSPVPLFGGAALTVINLVTREQYLQNSGEGRLTLSFNEDVSKRVVQGVRASAMYGHNVGKLKLSGFAQYYTDYGQPPANNNGTGGYTGYLRDLRDGTKHAANFTLNIATDDDKFVFQNWVQYTNRDAFLSGLVPSQSNDLYKYEGTQWVSNLRIRPWRNLQLLAGAMLAQWVNIIDYAGTPSGGQERNFNAFAEVNYEWKLKGWGEHSVFVGGKYEREGQYSGSIYTWNGRGLDESFDPNKLFAPNAQRDVVSAYADESWKILGGKLYANGSVRFDLYRGFGDNLEFAPSGRVGLSYNATKAFSLKALYATAVRPPSIYERLGSTLTPLAGSADIQSERIHTVELSAVVRYKGLQLTVTPLYEYFDNKIEYVPDATNTVFTARNNGATRVLGIEFDSRYTFAPRIYVYLNGAYIHSLDQVTDERTFFLPSAYLNGGVNYFWRGLNLNANAYFRDKRPLPAGLVQNAANTSWTANINASVSYSFLKSMRVFIAGENLADFANNIPLSVDGMYVPMRGRTIHAGLVVGPGVGTF